jgi:predicted nucleic acid-binding protein
LIAIGQSDLLSHLYGTILIPPGVAAELTDRGTPLVVMQWMSERPAWLQIVPLKSALDPALIANLDRGESEAIQLAQQVNAEILLIDERRGRAIAHQRGLPIAGALSVLGDAYRSGLTESPLMLLTDLRQAGFRISDDLVGRFQDLLRTRYAR